MSGPGLCSCCGQLLPYRPQKQIERIRKFVWDKYHCAIIDGDYDVSLGYRTASDTGLERMHSAIFILWGLNMIVYQKCLKENGREYEMRQMQLAPLFF